MFADMHPELLIKIKVIFPQCIAALLFSILYIFVYIKLRNVNYLYREGLKNFSIKMLLCVCSNFFLIAAAPFSDSIRYQKLLTFLFCVTENIDLIVQKIPTEILVFETLLIFLNINFADRWIHILTCFCSAALWLIGREKTGINAYDILLIAILCVQIGDLQKILIFDSIILMFWGGAGVILRSFYKRKPDFRIPLAPVIISALAVIKLLP